VTADAVLSRELNSLHEELSTSHRKRRSPHPGDGSASGAKAAPAAMSKDATEEQQLSGEFGDFVHVIKEFVEEAEKGVSSHPAASVIGAMVIGIMIGRLLVRR